MLALGNPTCRTCLSFLMMCGRQSFTGILNWRNTSLFGKRAVLQRCHNCFHLQISTSSLAWNVCLFLLLSSTLFVCLLVCITLYTHVVGEGVQFLHWFHAKPFDVLQTTNSELWILYYDRAPESYLFHCQNLCRFALIPKC